MTKFFQVRIDDERLEQSFNKLTPERGDKQRVLLGLVKKFVKGEVKI